MIESQGDACAKYQMTAAAFGAVPEALKGDDWDYDEVHKHAPDAIIESILYSHVTCCLA